MVLNWQADFRTWSADRVERARLRARGARIFGYSRSLAHHLGDFATGESISLEQAKSAAEASLADIVKGMHGLKSSDRAF